MDKGPDIRNLFVALQRLEFEKAARFDHVQLAVLAAASLLAGASVVLPEGRVSGIVAIASFALALAAFWFYYKNRERRAVAEKVRRATLLIDGLGLELSPAELRRYAVLSRASPEELKVWNKPDYFSSQEKPGVKRALDMLEESAFWSSQLFRASGETTGIVVVGLTAILVLCLLFSLSVLGSAHISAEVRVFSSIASSLVWIELLARTLHYFRAAKDVDEVLLRLETIRANGYRKDDWIIALVDYNSAVESAPMMFPGVYKRNQDRLNALWQGREIATVASRRVWVIAANDLEGESIIDLLSSKGERTIVSSQPWGASWEGLEPEHKAELRTLAADGWHVHGVELASADPYGAVNIDHHRYKTEDRWKPESSLEQVAVVLGVELNRRQKLIAANDRGYIPEMIRLGATPEEIEQIRRADRHAQGISEDDEKRAARDIAGAIDSGGGRVIVKCDRPTSAHLDLLFGKAKEVLLTGKDQWLYSGPRAAELAAMDLAEEHWSGGQADSGYFGISKPNSETDVRIRSWFIQ